MYILNYLMALSLLIISVAKTTEFFIKSDKFLEKIEHQFVDQTKSLLKQTKNNEKGSISLTAAALTLILSLIFIFYITKMKIEYREAVYRKESYLCFQYMNQKTISYISEMAKFNWALSAAYIAQFSVVATAEAIQTFKALVLTRNIRHFNYIKNLTTNKYCRIPEAISYLKNIPFKTKANYALSTNINEASIMRQSKWTYQYYKLPKGIRLKNSFCLKSDFQMKNAFFPSLKLTSQEFQMTGLSSLKCLPGSSSSPPS